MAGTEAIDDEMETSLYQPVKQFLESLGFRVKGEIGGCDLVGITEGTPPVVVIGEMKLTFNLDLKQIPVRLHHSLRA